MSALYDKIGVQYDTTRRADSEITRRLYNHLQVFDHSPVIDIACGTGNYTIALHQLGVNIAGVDISQEMLATAKEKSAQIQWYNEDVEHLPSKNRQYRGATCILAIHHFTNLYTSFKEVYRILDSGSRFVIFTSSPEQMEKYWLMEYFPQMMKKSMEQMPSINLVNHTLQEAGFSLIGNETFMIQPNLEDFFLYSGKYKPDMYLSEEVRRGISSFVSLADSEEIEAGVKRIEEDIHNGYFETRTKKYYSEKGDYAFVIAEKK